MNSQTTATVEPETPKAARSTDLVRRYSIYKTHAAGHFPGKGCKCAARNEDECACAKADWRPIQHVALRNALEELLKASLCNDNERMYQARANARELLDVA